MEAVKKILADNKQVKLPPQPGVLCLSTDWAVSCSVLSGERDRLVQTAQEHWSTDDLQRKDHPREAEESSVQPTHDLRTANAQQVNGFRLHAQDGVCCLHLTQQVSADILVFYEQHAFNHLSQIWQLSQLIDWRSLSYLQTYICYFFLIKLGQYYFDKFRSFAVICR